MAPPPTPWFSGRPASLAAVLAVSVFGTFPMFAEDAKLELVGKEAMQILGGYIPQRLALQPEAPAALRRAPADLKTNDTHYGSLPFGPAEARAAVLVAIEEPSGSPWRCWVDANGNGDLTDDPAIEWKPRAYKSRAGQDLKMHTGAGTVTVRHADEALSATLQFYRFDPQDPDRAQLKDTVLYYGDYLRRGTVEVGDRKIPALLCDDQTSGDFRGRADGEASGVRLALDLDGDGTFDRRPWESFDVRKPFNLGGTTWELAGLTWSGSALRVVKSSQTVAEVKPPAPLNPGDAFPPFEATTLDGKPVKFPGSFMGRLVILDFWATWCGPCIGELPNLKAAYAEFHPRGVEVLGVSLDDDGAADRVKAFLKKQDIAWSQVFEGGGWRTRLAKQYGIDSIPRVFLVDGDTGKILATTAKLRGPALSSTLQEQLAKRSGAPGQK